MRWVQSSKITCRGLRTVLSYGWSNLVWGQRQRSVIHGLNFLKKRLSDHVSFSIPVGSAMIHTVFPALSKPRSKRCWRWVGVTHDIHLTHNNYKELLFSGKVFYESLGKMKCHSRAAGERYMNCRTKLNDDRSDISPYSRSIPR